MKYLILISGNLLKSFLAFSMLFLLFSSSEAFSQDANGIVGVWLIQDNDAKVEIFEKAGKYYGKIAWMKYPKDDNGNDKVDDMNPDPKLRSRKKQGLVIMTGFVYNESSKEWVDGTIYDSKSGKTYDGYMKLEDDGSLYMKGYIMGMRFLGRSNIWTRAENE
ncbi:MAG: DUF2147 domain-containing protein [Bacteroidia bacterium]|nr:DUF2147 domain-containing protein [Bacteroidia bacterium]